MVQQILSSITLFIVFVSSLFALKEAMRVVAAYMTGNKYEITTVNAWILIFAMAYILTYIFA